MSRPTINVLLSIPLGQDGNPEECVITTLSDSQNFRNQLITYFLRQQLDAHKHKFLRAAEHLADEHIRIATDLFLSCPNDIKINKKLDRDLQ